MLQIQNFLAGLLIPRETLTLPECQWEQSHVRQREGQRASFSVPGREGISHPSTHFESEIRAARKERCSVPEQLAHLDLYRFTLNPPELLLLVKLPFLINPQTKVLQQACPIAGYLTLRILV